MVYKCKICGGETTVDTKTGIAVCDYCGTKQVLPLFAEESAKLLYDRGNHYLLHNEYDKAEAVFSQLLTIRPDASELFWDLVLCKYGVTYVCDPKTGKYIPTCNRTHYTSIYKDENYIQAMVLSSGEKQQLYQADAATIDKIQKGILAVSKKEKPFDIFLSYKETDPRGNRTKDSVAAQRLYEKLTAAGYKVFFSRITLEDKIGTEYEPYIYAALDSSKVMLTLCSCKEYIASAWVQNEWSRFLGFRQKDSRKTLLPLYFDMSRQDLPEEFSLFPAYDISADGFEEELLRGIKKLIPSPVLKAKRRKQLAKAAAVTCAGLVLIGGITAAIVIPKKQAQAQLAANAAAYQQAIALFERKDYTAAFEAFTALADYEDAAQMAQRCQTQPQYDAAMQLFYDGSYAEAAQAFVALGDYEDAAHMAQRCQIQPQYDAAMQLFYDGSYAEAAWAFAALGDYEDAAQQMENARISWRKSLGTVAVKNTIGDYKYGAYYINANNTVDSFPNAGGTSHQGTGIHIVSLSTGNPLFALEKNGKLEMASQNGQVDENQWQDIIQTTPYYIQTNAALKADGTVIFGKPADGDWYDSWLADAAGWKNIVLLAGDYKSDPAGGGSALAGVDKDGNVFLCGWYYCEGTFYDHKEAFQNIKTLDVSFNWDAGYLNAAALTKDGKLVSYMDGKLSVEEARDVVDVELNTGTLYTLHSDGKMYKNNTGSVLLADVVAMFEDYVITRSGTLYTASVNTDTELENTGVKGCVYDEWLARME